jgi:hypothetical protein
VCTMDMTITYDEVTALLRTIFYSSLAQILSKSGSSTIILSGPSNASHVHKAPYMGGKAW